MAKRTKQDLIDEANERGLTIPEGATVPDLEALLSTQAADQAVGPQHPASVVEEAPLDEKDGPGSIVSKETRPDERDLPPGTSALQAPAEA